MEAPTAAPAAAKGSAIVLPAMDGIPIAATVFNAAAPAPRGTLLVHAAAATPQRFYARFASYLAEGGVRVVTYDYRGVGRSRPRSLRGYPATMSDWAFQDARGAHRFVRQCFPDQPVAVLGHSFGGQLVGLIDEPREVAGAIFVASQLGYYGHWPWPKRTQYSLLWRALVPATTRAFGYLPGRVGLGEDLPRGVVEEWRRWCLAPDYLISGYPDAAERFARFDVPLAFYSFTDDPLAPERAVKALQSRLPAANLEHRRVDPRVLGRGAIGHHGFFREKCREPLWAEARTFLNEVFAGRTPSCRPASGAPLDAAWSLREEDVLADLRHCR
ncbi:MAG TPA: alpha/beta fold hydrolase [Polyangiaceae bacterium]|jgi:predicted alpha/beta hydrolase|nr:alpha/beta fold hydrolase [Polyangiaceae bacterium]